MLKKVKEIMNNPLKNRPFLQRCKQLFSVSLFSLSYVFAFQPISSAVPQNTQLQEWRFSPENALLEFTLSSAAQPQVFYLRQPPRLVIDLPSTKLGYVPTQENYSGAIQRIRLSQLNASVTRIVMDLTPGTVLTQNQVQLQPISTNPNRWTLRLSNNYSNTPGSTIYPPQAPIYQPQAPTYQSQPQIYQPQPPIYQSQPPIYQPQPQIYQSQPPIYQSQPSTLPSSNDLNPQPSPNVSVPPLTPNNREQIPSASMLPPANFSTPFGGVSNNASPLISPNFPVPNYPNNNPVNNPINNNAGSGVVPWGQNLPAVPQR